MNRYVTILFRMLLIALMSFSWAIAAAQDNGIENLRQTSKAFADVSRAVSPSVVFIQVEGRKTVAPTFRFPFNDENWFGNDLFERFFGERFDEYKSPRLPQNQREMIGQGSGFVFKVKEGLLKDKTYILTNNHVIENAEKITVVLQNDRKFYAQVVGADPQSDVALIEINTSNIPAALLGDSSVLEVGEWVIAIGSPFGLSHSLTVGVVSATGRTSLGINDYEDFIQTDAAINPGNSGGPLVNIDGEVIGMNTAIFSRSGGYMGIGFAIPINLVESIGEQLMSKGEVIRGHLGIVVQELSDSLAKSFGLTDNDGILVSQVMSDSPAAKAGLEQGDVITQFDGTPITTVGKFRNLVALSKPNSKKDISVVRRGKRINLLVVVGSIQNDKATLSGNAVTREELGMVVENITSSLAEQYDIVQDKGVIVTAVEPGSVAALAGIEPGTIILQVNRNPISNVQDFNVMLNEALKKNTEEQSVLLLLLRGNIQQFLALSWKD